MSAKEYLRTFKPLTYIFVCSLILFLNSTIELREKYIVDGLTARQNINTQPLIPLPPHSFEVRSLYERPIGTQTLISGTTLYRPEDMGWYRLAFHTMTLLQN